MLNKIKYTTLSISIISMLNIGLSNSFAENNKKKQGEEDFVCAQCREIDDRNICLYDDNKIPNFILNDNGLFIKTGDEDLVMLIEMDNIGGINIDDKFGNSIFFYQLGESISDKITQGDIDYMNEVFKDKILTSISLVILLMTLLLLLYA
ncbi:MAG: hypothetical protein R3Y64_09555 [Peptostreptococcaceae bacterium]